MDTSNSIAVPPAVDPPVGDSASITGDAIPMYVYWKDACFNIESYISEIEPATTHSAEKQE